MSVTEVLSRKSGVIVYVSPSTIDHDNGNHRNRGLTGNSGEDVRKLFKFAQQKGFAIPAINVTSSSTVNASLEAARDAKSPIILQVSQGGAAYFAGKGKINSVTAMLSESD